MTAADTLLPPRQRSGKMLLTLFLHARDWVPIPLQDGRTVPVVDHTRLTLRAEAAAMQAVFLADTFGLDLDAEKLPINSAVEPVTTMAYLAAMTRQIGLVATVSSTFTEPFNLVRQLGGLDALSRGRAGWNIVTSGWGGSYFGRTLPSHADRYRQAEEFVQLAKAIWHSWDDKTLDPAGAPTGIIPAHITRVDHTGEFFTFHGAADKPPSPQGHPLLVQAGSSADGIAFAARHAELVFTAQPFDDDADDFYRTLKAASQRTIADGGHWPLVLPGVTLVLSPSEKELGARNAAALATLSREGAIRALRTTLEGVKLDDLDLDDHIPAERLPPPETVNGRQTFYKVYRRRALDEGMTIRQLAHAANFHWQLHDTPEGAAQKLVARFERGNADGFNIMPTDAESYDLLFNRLIPFLQENDYARRDYASAILRENILATVLPPKAPPQ